MKSLRLLLLYILMGKEVAVMAVVYATLIVKGKLTTALIRRAAPLRGLPFLSRAEED